MDTLRIICVGKIVAGEFDWDVAPLPTDQQPPDGELQRLIDEGEMAEDYEDYLEDIEFWRTGC